MKQEIIYTEDYALVVSEEKPIEGQYFLFTPYNLVFKADSTEYGENAINTHGVEYVESFTDDRAFNVEYCKTVIAHLPLKDAPILKGVPLLPEFEMRKNIRQLAVNELFPTWDNKDVLEYLEQSQIRAFEKGYNKAKETYKYTQGDIMSLVQMVHEIYSDGLGVATDSKLQKVIDFVESLQQPKRPKYFEFEMEEDKDVLVNDVKEFLEELGDKPKTITNSEGRTEWVGKYEF